MQSEQSAPLLEDILLALGDKIGTTVTAEAVAEEVQRYLDYGVPPEQAKAAILRHHGVAAPKPTTDERRALADLRPSESFVNLLVRVVTINDKEITVKGEPRRIQYGIFGDETMTRPFTAWRTIDAKKGDVVRVLGAYTKPFQGAAEIHLGDRCRLEPAAADALPATPVLRTYKVRDLVSGLSNIDLVARVLSVAPRQVNVQGTEKTVWSGFLADETGKVGFTSWHDFGLKDAQVLRIQGGYVRSFRSTPQYTFDEKATIEVLPDDRLPAAAEIERVGPLALAELYTGAGAQDVTVEATLLEVRPGSGLVQRCPDCKRVLQNDECRTHGKKTGVTDLRIKAVLDDGTGAVNAVLGRETTEQLFGKTMDECLQIAKTANTPGAVEGELRAKLVGRPLRARGNVVVDDFGPTLLVHEAALLHRDLAAAAEALLAELEEAA